jgi:hypothetical protein
VGVISFKKNLEILKIVHIKKGEKMYLENLIIKVRERYNLKSDFCLRLKEYFFSLIRKNILNPLSPIIFCTYSTQKNVFAPFLGFTSSFMCDLIISYHWVCRVWMRGVTREIRKVLKMSNGEMFDKVLHAAMAEAYFIFLMCWLIKRASPRKDKMKNFLKFSFLPNWITNKSDIKSVQKSALGKRAMNYRNKCIELFKYLRR